MALYSDAAGRPLSKIYKRVGIRRDRNFSDLSSASASLENLLDRLINDTGNTFLATDLDAIKNIFSEGLTNEDYLKIAGSSAKYTTPDGNQLSFDPRITYQNRLDKIQIFSGIPRLNGGNGLTASYFQNDQILFDEHANFEYNIADVNTSGVFGGEVFGGSTSDGELPDDNFWEDGDFGYTAKVHPQSAKTNSGVKWEGYFIPRVTGKVTFEIHCTGYYTADFNKVGYEEDNDKNQTSASKALVGDGQVYDEYARVGVSTSIPNISGVSGTNTITVDSTQTEKMNTIGIGMTAVLPSKIATGSKIFSFDQTSGAITLVPPSGTTNAVTDTISNQSVTFTRSLGDEIISRFETPALIAFQKYRIRLRYFHHKNFESKDIIRSFDIDYQLRDMGFDDDLRFNVLYPLDYNFSDSAKGDFNIYFDNSVLFGGTNLVGIGNSINSSQYVKVKSTNKLDVTYRPKQELGDGSNLSTGIVRNQKNYNIVSGSSIIFCATGSDLTTGIEIGNYIINDNIPNDTRVVSVQGNQFIVMDKNATGSATGQQVKFINHRGFLKRVRVNANTGNNVINAATDYSFRAGTQNETTIASDAQKDMIVISANINNYKKIDSLSIDGTAATLSGNVTTVANEDVFVYQSRGLKDNSLQNFCDRFSNAPTVRCLISDIPEADSPLNVGTTSFKVEDLNGISNNWEAQGAYFGPNGTTISSIVDDPTDPNFKTITLASGITRPLPDGAQFTAVEPAKNTTDYQLCCPPTDTSPPFEPTEDGLNTTSGYKDFKLVEGNLVFDQLTLKDTTGNAADLADGDALSVNKKIDIKTPIGTFKILATT
tara:strand:+ start:619 stop:3090 length:2472 start_codon:yes stop_codon:yes gene_type:complete